MATENENLEITVPAEFMTQTIVMTWEDGETGAKREHELDLVGFLPKCDGRVFRITLDTGHTDFVGALMGPFHGDQSERNVLMEAELWVWRQRNADLLTPNINMQ